MARKPQVNYWESVGSWLDAEGKNHKGAFACRLAGKVVLLAEGPDDSPKGPTYLRALDRFREEMAMANLNRAGDGNTIFAVLESYLDHISTRLARATVALRRDNYKPFIAWKPEGFSKPIGQESVSFLTHKLVYDFIRHQQTARAHTFKSVQGGHQRTIQVSWADSTALTFLNGLNAAFNWAAKSGIITKNPIRGIEMPSAESRGEEALIGENAAGIEANHRLILATVPRVYKQICQILKDTGARPGEILAATAADFNPKLGAIVYPKISNRRNRAEYFTHKTAAKGKTRCIFLTGESLAIVRQLVEQYPEGPLFRSARTKHGRVSKDNLCELFTGLQTKLNMPNLTAYSYRHTFATEMLKAGCDVDSLAEMMGNSPAIIRKHYSHLLADKAGLRAKLEAIMKASQASAGDSPSVLPFSQRA